MCFIYITLPTSWAEMVQNINKTICLALGNRVWNIVPLNTSPCLLSTPSAPYADWSGFNVLLSRDFNTVPVWDNIGILNTNTVFSLCYVLVRTGGSNEGRDKMPDRWPHYNFLLWNTIGLTWQSSGINPFTFLSGDVEPQKLYNRQYHSALLLSQYPDSRSQSLMVGRKRKFQFNFPSNSDVKTVYLK